MSGQDREVNRMQVTINGDRYVLKSRKNKEEMERVTDYVNWKIGEINRSDLRFNKTMQTTLAMMNMTDDLFLAQDELREVEEEKAGLEEEVRALQAENKELKDRIHRQEEASIDREEDLKALRENLKASEDKILLLSKQFQEYQRTHR
ncbi:cell division protein ZapA [Kallipyga massiliensis]|uniref:cell division protein ZapA n=1 Tax=Kallipyga massiliensis TaxID=1472764 RepID=UPI0004B4492A|nr:cell division protein ZapA [Kallipyga massiliensis]